MSARVFWLVFSAALVVACNNLAVLVDQGVLTLRVFVDPEELTLVIDGEPKILEVTLTREGDVGPVNLQVDGVPAGVEAEINQPGITNTGTVTFQATAGAEPQQDVPVTVIASDGQVFDMQEVRLNLVR